MVYQQPVPQCHPASIYFVQILEDLIPLLDSQGQANSLHAQIGEIQERRTQADKARQGDKSFLQLRQAQQVRPLGLMF